MSESECKVETSDSIGSLLTPQLAASRQAICAISSSQNSCSGKNSKFDGIKANHEIGKQNAQLKSSLEISSTDGNWEIVRNNSDIGPTNQGKFQVLVFRCQQLHFYMVHDIKRCSFRRKFEAVTHYVAIFRII